MSGYAYVDANRNSQKDAGEQVLPGVTITGPNGATQVTDATGRYEFSALISGNYSVSAPASAAGYALFTSASLTATVTAPNSRPPIFSALSVAPWLE